MLFYKRRLLLGYVAPDHCSENPAPCNRSPANGALLSEQQRMPLLQGVERGRERNETKCISAIHERNARQDLPTRSSASPGLSLQRWCAMQRAGACTTPQRHAVLSCKRVRAPSRPSFPRPRCSGGNSCRMLPHSHLILSHL